MKMKCWPLVVLLAMMAWACSDDDGTKEPETQDPDTESPEDPEGRKLVFAVNGNVISSASSYWLMISDNNGKVLDAALLKNNESHTFEADEDFDDETVTLTVVHNYTPTYTSIDTYAKVPFGEYGISPVNAGLTPGKVKVNLEGYEGRVYYTVPSGPKILNPNLETFTNVDNVAKISFTTLAKTSKVLISNSEAPFEYVYGDFEQGKEYDFAAGDLEHAETLDLPWPGDAQFAGWQITGINSEGNFLYYRMNRERSPSDPEQFQTVPTIPNFFTSYSIVQSATTDNVSNDYFYKSNTVGAEMKYVDATFEYAQNGNRFTWQTTGAVDAVWLQAFARPEGGQADWRVHAPAGIQDIVVPVIPASVTITTPNMQRSFDAFVESGNSFSSILREFPGQTSYLDVDVKPNLVPGTSLNWTELLTKSTEYIPQ